MKRTFSINHKGVRYWATGGRNPSNGRPMLIFWSSHKGLFYHGHYTPDVIDPEDCWQHFINWLPFKYFEFPS